MSNDKCLKKLEGRIPKWATSTVRILDFIRHSDFELSPAWHLCGGCSIQLYPMFIGSVAGVAGVAANQRGCSSVTTSSPAKAAKAGDAAAAGVWANSADDPANCTFILPAVARRGRRCAGTARLRALALRAC